MAVRRYPAPERPRQGEADAGRNRLPDVRVKRAKGGEKAVGEGEGEAGVLLVCAGYVATVIPPRL
jgi:hypothetical protein